MGNCQSMRRKELYERPTKKQMRDERAENRLFQDNIQFLGNVPLFGRLHPSDVPIFVEALVQKEWEPGSVVIKEGDKGNEFFVIKSGEGIVLKGEEEIKTLHSKDYFGETSLLDDVPRNATIKCDEKAKEPLVTLSISRSRFEDLGVRERICFPRRQAVAAGSSGNDDVDESRAEARTKNEEEEELIVQALNENKYLSSLLTEQQIKEMTGRAWRLSVNAGTKVITEGDLRADRFYIVNKGSFELKKQMRKNDSVVDEILNDRNTGQSFGELALLYNAPRAATVTAKVDSELWVIDRADFKQILRQQAQKKLDVYSKLLSKVETLSILLADERQALVECLVEIHFRKGQNIITEGANGSTFYFLIKGSVSYSKGGEVFLQQKADPSAGECPSFGEKALLENEPRAATVTVESETAAVLALSRETFEEVLGPLKEILKESRDGAGQQDRKSLAARARGPVTNLVNKQSCPKLNELRQVAILGSGGFGSVTLVYEKKHKRSFALKKISKGFIVKMHLQDQISNERKILAMTSSKFIATFYCTYNSDDCIFFLLEACLGGEIFAIYNGRKLHGKYSYLKFYSACVVKAFEHLHERRIIYRDLKPENMLLDDKGYCKLTDMGLAKFVIGRTYTTCGTPDYFAPEIIQSCGHTIAVDWWTFGILVYELISGHPPFEGLDAMARYKKILQGINQARFEPKSRFTEDAIDLIKGVCDKDPSQRLPMRGGLGGVKKNLYTHPLYDAEKWDKLDQGTLNPPWKPKVKGPQDFSNFGYFAEEDCPPSLPYVDPGTGWDKDF